MRPSALEVCQGLRALLSSTPAEAGCDDASPGELAGVPIHKTGIGTADILRSLGNGVVNHQGMYTKVKLLGKGGVSVVHLCRLTEKVCGNCGVLVCAAGEVTLSGSAL